MWGKCRDCGPLVADHLDPPNSRLFLTLFHPLLSRSLGIESAPVYYDLHRRALRGKRWTVDSSSLSRPFAIPPPFGSRLHTRGSLPAENGCLNADDIVCRELGEGDWWTFRCCMIRHGRPLEPPTVSDHGRCAPCDSTPDLGEPDDDFDQDVFSRVHPVHFT
jgi:hypothetical protein